MFDALARLIVRRRRAAIVSALLFLAVSLGVGGGLGSRLDSGGFENPGAESVRATAALERLSPAASPDLVLVLSPDSGDVDSAASRAAGEALAARLAAEDGIVAVQSYWATGGPALRSRDGRHALVLAFLKARDDGALTARIGELAPAYEADLPGMRVGATGSVEVFRQMREITEADLARGELLSLPVTLVLLVVVFGSAVAAGLPLVVAAFAVFGTLLVLRGVTLFTDVSVFALNLTTAMGLGLGIDYSLLVVSRFREERDAGRHTDDAVVRTVRTAGRTVAFSAVTVAVSLSALFVFPITFLRSFAWAGIAVVLLAAVGAMVFLPALLALLGPRVERGRVRRRRTSSGAGGWHRVAMFVMRRPWPVALSVTTLLLLLGTPFLDVRFGQADDRAMPPSAPARQAAEVLRTSFDGQGGGLTVVAAGIGDPAGRATDIHRYAAALSRVPGVARVDALTGSYAGGAKVADAGPASAAFAAADGTWLAVTPGVPQGSPQQEALVESLRAVPSPLPALLTGAAAELVDTKQAVAARLPIAVGLIAAVTFTVLFLLFGSLLVPAKAVVLNLLSLTATFGAMVWIFQEGNLSGLLGFTPTGFLEVTTPILMFCLAFGLSMDYEVFLLARIKEERDHGADDVQAVARGLERTGGIVTAAALILAVVFLAFATSRLTFVKLMGVGMALAVLMDAFLVRATLVPAFMRLAGRANWWAPGPLRRLHARFGIRETSQEASATTR